MPTFVVQREIQCTEALPSKLLPGGGDPISRVDLSEQLSLPGGPISESNVRMVSTVMTAAKAPADSCLVGNGNGGMTVHFVELLQSSEIVIPYKVTIDAVGGTLVLVRLPSDRPLVVRPLDAAITAVAIEFITTRPPAVACVVW
jgi:hypothetical protein